jgi:fumarylacetoacetate (FAA) hydrolase
MKLATLKDGTRDGQLCVVSKDLSKFHPVSDVCRSLQLALDDWDEYKDALQSQYDQLCSGDVAGESFEAAQFHSPLPRAYQWADGSAYVNHVQLVRRARGAEMPESFWTDPLMYQGGSDSFIGPRDPIVADEAWGIDFEGEIAVMTGDVPMGASLQECESAIRLVLLVNDVSLRNLIPAELGKGFGFFQSKPSSAFSPVAVTLDELGQAWHDGKLHLPLTVHLNDEQVGCPEAGEDMVFNFPTLIKHAAKTRPLAAGTIIGSGTVSNKDTTRGIACLAERRMLEIIETGSAKTPFMSSGDRVAIEMLDKDGQSIFGKIEQECRRLLSKSEGGRP